jgi:site-specific DNA-methyltransferase (adenine-specific)
VVWVAFLRLDQAALDWISGGLTTMLNPLPSKPAFQSTEGDFTLYKGNSLRLLKRMESESVDMVFADPPYFLSNGGKTCKSGKLVDVDKGKWDSSRGIDQDFQFQFAWLKECQRILRPTGSLWVSGTRHNIFSVGFAMQKLGYKLLNDIAWYKVNPPPNLSCRYFTHSTETVVWAARDNATKWTFNYKLIKRLNGGKQMKSMWSILSPRGDEKVFGKHPTQKPIALLERIVLASTHAGDLVLDPFAGSATTGLAANRLNRRFIGIELADQYIELARQRYLAEQQSQVSYGNDVDYVAAQIGLQ